MPEAGGGEAIQRSGVLIVEDDRDGREAMSLLLRQRGFSVIAVEDGRKAMDVLGASGVAMPAIIILDLMMPLLTGWTFLEILAGSIQETNFLRGVPRDIPIIVVTGATNPGNVERYPNVCAVLKKPLDFDALIAAVDRLCRLTSSRRINA